MPLFECSKCKAIDNTALGTYWERQFYEQPPLCVECETGTWHKIFPKRTAAESGYVKDARGFFGPPEAPK